MFRKEKKLLSYSPEKIADLYLRALASGREVFLTVFLAEQGIYADIDILNKVRGILERGEYVKKEKEGFAVFTYNPPGTAFQDISGEIATIPQVTITDKGRHFVNAGQEFDVEGKKVKSAKREKRNEKIVSAAISFGTALLTMLAKWYFFDSK